MLNVSSDFLSAIKQGSRTVNASVGIGDMAITNKISNGDFSNGTTGVVSITSTISVVNGELNFVATATGGNSYIVGTGLTVGDKLYGCAKIKASNNKVKFLLGGTQVACSGTGAYEFISTLHTATSTQHGCGIADSNTSGWVTQYIDNIFFVNLTQTFGAGNEPSKDYMDSLMAKVGWFGGTKNVPAQFLGDRIFNNKITNGDFSKGTTGWVVTNGVLSASNKTLTDTAGATYAYSYTSFSCGSGSGYASHKYYTRMKASVTNANCTMLKTFLTTGAWVDNASQTNPVNGQQYTLSAIKSPSADGTLSFGICQYYADTATANGKAMNISEVLVVDLTALYGAGNEPDKAYMDSLITASGWFNQYRIHEDACILGDFNIDSALGNGNLPSIGATISNKLTMSVINDATLPQTIIGKAIRPYVALDVTGTGSYEWVKLGEFYADYDGVDIGKLETTLEAFDMMADYMDITYKAVSGLTLTVQGVLNDLATNYGVRFATQSGLPTSSVLKVVPLGSVRQVISEMASYMSTNATIDSDGCVKFVFMNTIPSATFSLGLDNYSDFKLQPDSTVSFTQLIGTDGNNEVPWGNDSGYALSFQNAQVTTVDDVKVVYNRLFPINYYAYTMKAQGMPHLEIGDVISFTYLKLDGTQATINIPILKHKFTFKGAFVSEFSASAPTQQTTSVTVTSGSSLADAVDVTYGDLKEAIEMATQQITGNQGGYITTVLDSTDKPLELVISNTPDYNTADKVWRWNSGGLGFSDTGYNGEFGLALTADGQIVADKVTAGIFNANIIKAGIIKDVKNQSWINMADGTFNFGNGKLTWDGSAFNINFAGTSIEDALGNKVESSDFAPYQSNISFNNGIITLGQASSPFSVNITNQAVEFIDNGTTGGTLNLTAISGNGTSVTCTYPSQAVIPYQVGGYVQIAGCSVSAYNGTWLITSCTKTQVVLACKATGTVASGFGTVQYGSSPNTVAYINGQKMYITNLQATETMQVGNHQITKYDSDITLIKYAG